MDRVNDRKGSRAGREALRSRRACLACIPWPVTGIRCPALPDPGACPVLGPPSSSRPWIPRADPLGSRLKRAPRGPVPVQEDREG